MRIPILSMLCLLGTMLNADAQTDVVTIAGNGTPGNLDGPAQTAQFLMPAGIAYDRNGNLIIADAAGQRIRRLSQQGIVTTIAGGGGVDATGTFVPGSYRDGVGNQARFNQPLGLAVDGDRIFVADTRNHCIRLVEGNRVSTFAGSPLAGKGIDGPVGMARFAQPRAIALDPNGTMYVADFTVGLRKITPQGQVSTLSLPFEADTSVTSVSLVRAEQQSFIFVAVADKGIVVLKPNGGVQLIPTRVSDFPPGSVHLDGGRPVGQPYAVAGINPQRLVYSDIRDNSIRYLDGTLGISLLSEPQLDAMDAGGFRDGDSMNALANTPMGIAISELGSVTFADAGNRRIRSIRVDHEQIYNPTFDKQTPALRILYAGDDNIQWDVPWGRSIPGIIATKLSANWSLEGSSKNHASIEPLRGMPDLESIANVAGRRAQDGQINALFLQLNSQMIMSNYGLSSEAQFISDQLSWQPKLVAYLRKLNDNLAAHHVKLVLIIQPFGYEVSPNEQIAYIEDTVALSQLSYDGSSGAAAAMLDAVKGTGIRFVDLFSVARAFENAQRRGQLFNSFDGHISSLGSEFFADSIFSAISQTDLISSLK